MNDEYLYDFFLEIKHLRFERLDTDPDANKMREALGSFIPRGKGTIARMHNRSHGGAYTDYVIVMEDMIYFAIIVEDAEGYHMRSVKVFKARDIIAHAFILEGVPGGPPEDEPQIRLMLREGLRMRLVFDEADHTHTVAQFQELATKQFFLS